MPPPTERSPAFRKRRLPLKRSAVALMNIQELCVCLDSRGINREDCWCREELVELLQVIETAQAGAVAFCGFRRCLPSQLPNFYSDDSMKIRRNGILMRMMVMVMTMMMLVMIMMVMMTMIMTMMMIMIVNMTVMMMIVVVFMLLLLMIMIMVITTMLLLLLIL